MSEIQKRRMLLRDFQKGFLPAQATAHIEEKFGIKGYRIRTVQRWFKKFRDGDLSLEIRPNSGYTRVKPTLEFTIKKESTKTTSRKAKPKRVPQKEIIVESVTFKQEQKQRSRVLSTSQKSESVQKLIQYKPEITVSKVKGGVVPKKDLTVKMTPNRVPKPTTKSNNVSAKKNVGKTTATAAPVVKKQRLSKAPLLTMPKLRPVSGLEADLQLPPNIAKRMIAPPTLTENHSISEGRKSAQKTGEAVKKLITVQFQNVDPDIAKNTVRKIPETPGTPFNAVKRLSVPQSTPLSSPKGVIYLNPQEIFRQSFDYLSSQQRPASNNPFPKPIRSLIKVPLPISPLAAAPQPVQPTIEIIDSDNDSDSDDLVFPEGVPVPPPKMNVVAETFTTYWDMETDKPILLNPAEDLILPTPPIIEID